MNNVELSGNLVRDPAVTFTAKGTAKCSFTIAQNIGKGDAKRGHFFKCVAWKDVAEGIAEKYVKGKPIQVRGMLTQDQWTDKDGGKRSEVVIVVFEASVPEYAKKDAPPDDDIPF